MTKAKKATKTAARKPAKAASKAKAPAPKKATKAKPLTKTQKEEWKKKAKAGPAPKKAAPAPAPTPPPKASKEDLEILGGRDPVAVATARIAALKKNKKLERERKPREKVISKINNLVGRITSLRLRSLTAGEEQLQEALETFQRAGSEALQRARELPEDYQPTPRRAPPTPKVEIEAGGRVSIRPRHRGVYNEVIDEKDMEGLRVEQIRGEGRKSRVVVSTAKGEKLFIPRSHLLALSPSERDCPYDGEDGQEAAALDPTGLEGAYVALDGGEEEELGEIEYETPRA